MSNPTPANDGTAPVKEQATPNNNTAPAVNDVAQPSGADPASDDAKPSAAAPAGATAKSDSVTPMSDVFKQFASKGINWVDMMAQEDEQKNITAMENIKKQIATFKDPFIVYVSNLERYVTAEDIYYFFGGREKVFDVYVYGDGSTGEALVELNDRDALAEALMQDDALFFKKKVKIEYVEPVKSVCYTISKTDPTPPMSAERPPQPTSLLSQEFAVPPPPEKYRNQVPHQVPPQASTDNRYYRDNNRPPVRNRDDRNRAPPLPRYDNRGSSNRPLPPRRPSPPRSTEPPRPVEPTRPSEPKPSPFGQAKPVDTSKKLSEVEAKMKESKIQPPPPPVTTADAVDNKKVASRQQQTAKPVDAEKKPDIAVEKKTVSVSDSRSGGASTTTPQKSQSKTSSKKNSKKNASKPSGGGRK